MRIVLPVLACVLAAGGCSAEPEAEQSAESAATPSTAATTPVAVATATASAAPAAARSEKVSNDLYEFEYTYPVEAAVIPDLRKMLDADLEKERRELIGDAQEQLDESKKSGFPFNPFGYWASWKTVTDLPGWLSLSGTVSTYEGGAHPNHGFDTILWDKQANLKRKPEDMFTSEAALSRAIRADFCRILNQQRAEKRGAPVKAGSDDPFSECIDPVDSTVILGSSNRKAFDRIGILVAPYEAGPYAEGEYEVTLPVTDAVLATVKPEFRATFVKGR